MTYSWTKDQELLLVICHKDQEKEKKENLELSNGKQICILNVYYDPDIKDNILSMYWNEIFISFYLW